MGGLLWVWHATKYKNGNEGGFLTSHLGRAGGTMRPAQAPACPWLGTAICLREQVEDHYFKVFGASFKGRTA